MASDKNSGRFHFLPILVLTSEAILCTFATGNRGNAAWWLGSSDYILISIDDELGSGSYYETTMPMRATLRC